VNRDATNIRAYDEGIGE